MEGRTMGHLFTVAHVSQLHEIQRARLRRGEPGVGKEVQRFISELTLGRASDRQIEPPEDDCYWEALRLRQAKVLWDKGWGKEDYQCFSHYRNTIPAIPKAMRKFDPDFPLLILVDSRMPLHTACLKAGILICEEADFVPKKADFIPPSTANGEPEVRWICCQDGRRYRGKVVEEVLAAFSPHEVPLTAIEGVSVFVQRPDVVEAHFMYLWATSPVFGYGVDMNYGACLGIWDEGCEPELDFAAGIPSDFLVFHRHGMASRLDFPADDEIAAR